MIFNEYGAMHHASTEDLCEQLNNMVISHLEELISEDTSLTEIRAVAQYITSSIDCCASECILREAMKMRKAKRNEHS